jgi:two-component sensor histidine kinase
VTDFLVQRIARQPRSITARMALGLGLAAVALGIRLALASWIGLGAPFAAFVLAVLVATVFGGVLSGVSAMVALSLGGVFLLEPQGPVIATRRLVLGVAFFVASSGFVIWVVTLLRAALQREVAAREGERLLKLELHHRVKNTLAIVQSLADQTFRGATDIHAARREFAARLTALAGAHDLLVETGWRDVSLEALAARALAPFHSADGARLAIAGEPVQIAPETAVALVLCLHELATNAAKHGALSAEAGQVRLSWRVDETGGRRRLELEWRETGGRTPEPRTRDGFGTRLLTRALAARPDASSSLTLAPEGARWVAGFDL